ncbi:hypothetical protein C0J52_23570, partial [Blattella germanica]
TEITVQKRVEELKITRYEAIQILKGKTSYADAVLSTQNTEPYQQTDNNNQQNIKTINQTQLIGEPNNSRTIERYPPLKMFYGQTQSATKRKTIEERESTKSKVKINEKPFMRINNREETKIQPIDNSNNKIGITNKQQKPETSKMTTYRMVNKEPFDKALNTIEKKADDNEDSAKYKDAQDAETSDIVVRR